MRITISDRYTKEAERTEFEFTNDELENDNFITLYIGDLEYNLPLDNLYHTVKTFYDYRQTQRERDDFLVRQNL